MHRIASRTPRDGEQVQDVSTSDSGVGSHFNVGADRRSYPALEPVHSNARALLTIGDPVIRACA
jgi:hypothetical protein